MPDKITASYQIVTPMFIGDSNQQATAINPAAVKGALRFWWRALNWSRIRGAVDSENDALCNLHKEESTLFGSAADLGGSQSSFRILVAPNNLANTSAGSKHMHFKLHNASRYLGYGLMEAFASRKKGTEAGQLVRGCINEGQAFEVSILSRKAIDPSLIEAMVAFGLLGSLGSRARHGMGSVALQQISRGEKAIWEAPINSQKYTQYLQTLISQANRELPPFSAFSSKSRIDILLSDLTCYRVLDGFASRQLLFRSWGKDGSVLNANSEKRFKSDHDWSKGDRPSNFHPRRVVFGLPHNYGPTSRLSVTTENYERRSSPLIFHVHKIGSEYIGVSTLLESQFLPEGERINAGGTKVPAKIEWNILHDFLDGKDKQGNVRFDDRERVL